jgi:hypothetical protein
MDKRLKELAEQAKLIPMWVCVNEPTGSQMIKPIDEQTIERFAELVRQDEREACAKVCEKVHDDYINDRNNDGYDWPDGHNCADAIRARCEK